MLNERNVKQIENAFKELFKSEDFYEAAVVRRCTDFHDDWVVWLFFTRFMYEGTHSTSGPHEFRPYPNIMDEEAVAKFIEVTHKGYENHIGDLLGTVVKAIFTDEPGLMTAYNHPRQEMVYRPVPWSFDFHEEFNTRQGYDLIPYLPALFSDTGPQGIRYRHDFQEIVAELVAERFFWSDRRLVRGERGCLHGTSARRRSHDDAPDLGRQPV